MLELTSGRVCNTESRDREWDFSRKFLRVENESSRGNMNENESSGGEKELIFWYEILESFIMRV